MKPNRLDAKLIAAWRALEPGDRDAIKAAVTARARFGARIDDSGKPRRIKSALGWVVWDSWVTGLATQMLEALAFNGEEA